MEGGGGGEGRGILEREYHSECVIKVKSILKEVVSCTVPKIFVEDFSFMFLSEEN